MLQIWQITPTKNLKLDELAVTLDEVTQRLPEGYYSTFRTFDGGNRVLGLTHHLQRLYKPVSTPEVNESFLRRQLSRLLDAYRPGEARVRTVMTMKGQVYLAITPLQPLPGEIYEKGVRVATAELQREHPHLKSTSFIGRSDSERKYLAQEGIFEALLVKDGKVLEGMTSNFFYVGQAGHLPYIGTAGDDILLGITRETVMEIARGRGLEMKYQPLPLDQVTAIDEAFITSSSRGIVPVVQIDGAIVGQGRPGPVTQQLRGDYEPFVIERAEKIVP